MKLSEANSLAKSLMSEHGLEGWSFSFCNHKTAFGWCDWYNKEIKLSKPLTLLNDRDKVLDTILHEIAHALTPDHYHDKVWRAKAIEIGCDGKRYYDRDTIQPPATYVGTCPNGHTAERYRLTKRSRRMACGKCCRRLNDGHYSPDYIFNWKRNA